MISTVLSRRPSLADTPCFLGGLDNGAAARIAIFSSFHALAAIPAQVCPNRIMEWDYPWSRHLSS